LANQSTAFVGRYTSAKLITAIVWTAGLGEASVGRLAQPM
jgi:hypothetical protein